MDRPLRLISTDTIVGTPIDALARTIEALLVVASQPLSVEELAEPPTTTPSASRRRSGCSASATARAGAGSCSSACRAATPSAPSREAAEACGRLFERPVERGLSQAALETLAIVAYLGPVSRPEIARIRGVAADSTVASLVERGLIAEAGRESGPGGAVRYRVTPLFERVFGLDTLAELPRLDDLGGETEAIRERLLEVAAARAS